MLIPWRGRVAIEGEETGDGRLIVAGALEWGDLPLPLASLAEEQHGDMLAGGTQIGTIDTLTRTGSDIMGTGSIDDEIPEGAELVRRLQSGTASHGERQGISIDPDNAEVEYVTRDASAMEEGIMGAAGDPDPGEGGGPDGMQLWAPAEMLARYTRMRIRGATACAIPAFAGAYIELDTTDVAAGRDDEVVAEDGGEGDIVAAGSRTRSVVTAAAPVLPPPEWFGLAEPDPAITEEEALAVYGVPDPFVPQPGGTMAVPFTIRDDGLVFGHGATWGTCHTGYPGQCIEPPRGSDGYAGFHVGAVVCADGTQVATGPLAVGCDHAAADLLAPAARDHYANAGLAFADVRASNGALGVWISGALRPGIDDATVRALRASSLSGDWRRIGVDLDLIGILAVSTPGFPVRREAVTASHPMVAHPRAGYAGHDQISLVAAGMVTRCSDCERNALAAATLGASGPELAEMRAILDTLERRTRHLLPDAVSAAAGSIRARHPLRQVS